MFSFFLERGKERKRRERQRRGRKSLFFPLFSLSIPDTRKKIEKLSNRMLDAAFVDRADVVLRLGPPPAAARYSMLAASVAELAKARIVRGVDFTATFTAAAAAAPATAAAAANDQFSSSSSSSALPLSMPEEAFAPSLSSGILPPLAAHLAAIAVATEGFSGRSLRRLPFAALSDNVGLSRLEEAAASAAAAAPAAAAAGFSTDNSDNDSWEIDASAFMEALAAAAEAEKASRGAL